MLRQHEVVGARILSLEGKRYKPYVKRPRTGMWILANDERNKEEKLTASQLEIAFVEPNGASISRYLHISISQYRFLVWLCSMTMTLSLPFHYSHAYVYE
eukprot:GHVU01093440.1.p3 GENE.GHVU01093440.1~~GHVU01093440.1.p3  ORF type:complete len:100 (-),score=6.70 GHVU01093440.1:2696-2995(-)